MDINDFRSNSSIQIENMKATMSALRSQLDQEKEKLKNDIVQTLKCKSILGTGSADLLYTSGLLARLKSLEDSREPPPQHPVGRTSVCCLKDRPDEETHTFADGGDVQRQVYSNVEGSNCIRHCCSLKSTEEVKSTSGVQMRTFSYQNFAPPNSNTHQKVDCSLSTVEEDPGACTPERPLPQHNSWSGDATYIQPVSKGHYPTEEPNPYYDPQYNFRPGDPAINQCLHQNQCHYAPYVAPGFINRASEPCDFVTDPFNIHCAGCCTRKLPEVTQSIAMVSSTEVQQEENRQCTNMNLQCHHGTSLHHCYPKTSPRQYLHRRHQKVPRQNSRHHTKKNEKEVKRVDKPVYSEAAAEYVHSQEQPVKSGHAVGTQVDENDGLEKIHRQNAQLSKKSHMTPRSSSPGSTLSGKARENLVYEEPRESVPNDVVQCHYTNEISSQKSEGSSLFGSEIALDEEVRHLTYTQKRPKAHSIKPRRRGGKRSTGSQGTDKSGGATLSHGGTIERSKSTPHTLHCQFANTDPCEKAASETATSDITKGLPRERQKLSTSKKSPKRRSKCPPTQKQPTSAHSLPRKKKHTLKNDPLKPLETFYASLAAVPWTSGKRSDRSDTIFDRFESARGLNTKALESNRKKSSKSARPPNPFTLILDELRSSPTLRKISLSSGRKL